jgi:hypothetical protein
MYIDMPYPPKPDNYAEEVDRLMKSFMEKMGIYEYIPYDEQRAKIKEHDLNHCCPTKSCALIYFYY